MRALAKLAAVCVLMACVAHAQTPAAPEKGTMHAKGSFEVKLTPQTDAGLDPDLGRMRLDKKFHGDLEATSVGQMLTGSTAMKGSGAYVAVEKVTGTLNGRNGSFLLQHKGVMDRGTPELSVTVVPDSGTGQLAGLEGTMKIIIEGGQHSYEFDYRFRLRISEKPR